MDTSELVSLHQQKQQAEMANLEGAGCDLLKN